MGKLTVFHGSHHVVANPICGFGRDKLDFGKGFYVTSLRVQAEDWAKRPSVIYADEDAILNIYTLDKERYLAEGKAKIFTAYDQEWLRFIVESRMGKNPWEGFDYIEGGVANDRVIDTVNLYIAGLTDLRTALTRLSMHQPNNQICLLNQALTDKYLNFEGYEKL